VHINSRAWKGKALSYEHKELFSENEMWSCYCDEIKSDCVLVYNGDWSVIIKQMRKGMSV
jgi:hypothetical protein